MRKNCRKQRKMSKKYQKSLKKISKICQKPPQKGQKSRKKCSKSRKGGKKLIFENKTLIRALFCMCGCHCFFSWIFRVSLTLSKFCPKSHALRDYLISFSMFFKTIFSCSEGYSALIAVLLLFALFRIFFQEFRAQSSLVFLRQNDCKWSRKTENIIRFGEISVQNSS